MTTCTCQDPNIRNVQCLVTDSTNAFLWNRHSYELLLSILKQNVNHIKVFRKLSLATTARDVFICYSCDMFRPSSVILIIFKYLQKLLFLQRIPCV
jgi:hypothetical protein